jgi:formylglycine-generating enzyme required for sulfatase activity
MSDSSKNPQATDETGLRIVSDFSLALLGKGASPVLDEMVSRSLAQIQSNRTSGLIQSGSELVAPLKAGDEREFEIAPGVKIVMCWIPPGDFLMGSPEDEEGHSDYEIQFSVKITQGFWLAKTQITQAQWRAVMGNNPSDFEGDDLPVEHVSWNDICGDASRTGGFLGKINHFGSVDGRFDLPSEAQWEYAARAGTTSPYAGDLDEMAWYCENSDDETHPVGLKKSNDWGVHDMLGNVEEWCADWHDWYDVNAVEGPTGPSLGSGRVLRGGCWNCVAESCRVASRNLNSPSRHVDQFYGGHFGFRIVCNSVLESTRIEEIQQKQ